MGFKCGIVGLPNVGKSTLFNALTKASIDAKNYPFCTIEPNIGTVAVPDSRLAALSRLVQPEKTIASTIQFVDIAGLVQGASQGEGLGNQFLANIRETDAIAHVIRCFKDDDIVHVSGQLDPIDDIELVHTELALADLETLDKASLKLQKHAKSGDKSAQQTLEALAYIKAPLETGQLIRTLDLSNDLNTLLKPLHFLTAKPILYIANVGDTQQLEQDPIFQIMQAFAEKEHAPIIPINASIEAEISELNDEDKMIFLSDLGLTAPGLERVIRAGYALLNLEVYFTAGKKEVRAWTILKGTTAPKAAGVIHTDFEKGFIRAETIHYEDYVAYQGEQGAKEAGKMQLEGKQYIVQDGDIIHFRFNN